MTEQLNLNSQVLIKPCHLIVVHTNIIFFSMLSSHCHNCNNQIDFLIFLLIIFSPSYPILFLFFHNSMVSNTKNKNIWLTAGFFFLVVFLLAFQSTDMHLRVKWWDWRGASYKICARLLEFQTAFWIYTYFSSKIIYLREILYFFNLLISFYNLLHSLCYCIPHNKTIQFNCRLDGAFV